MGPGVVVATGLALVKVAVVGGFAVRPSSGVVSQRRRMGAAPVSPRSVTDDRDDHSGNGKRRGATPTAVRKLIHDVSLASMLLSN